MMRVVAVMSLATGMVMDLAQGGYAGKETGEHALARKLMLTSINHGDILLGDRYYPSFFFIAELKDRGADGIFQMHASRKCDFRRGKRLGKKDHLVSWPKPAKPSWMSQTDYDAYPDTIKVREISVKSQRHGFKTETKVLVTTLINEKKITKHDLALLYDCRWFVEIDFRAIKETMKMGVLRSKTPAMIIKELWAYLLAYNLIRAIMARAALKHGKVPRQLSFKLAMQCISAFCQFNVVRIVLVINDALLSSIAYKTVGNRPNRSEPRMVKRRPKAFPRLQKPRSEYHT